MRPAYPESGIGREQLRWWSRSCPPGMRRGRHFPIYAKHGVDELLIVDPQKRSVDWLALKEGEYRPVRRSGVIEFGPAELHDEIDWPSG